MLTPLPQIIPSEICLACDVCCRFPSADSPLRPYFTSEEIREAVKTGLPADVFPDSGGSRITLKPHGEGYICPAFDPETHHCRIYSIRPLDCQLYPFTVIRDSEDKVLRLGLDRLCPFVRDESRRESLEAFGADLVRRLRSPEAVELLRNHPGLIQLPYETVALVGELSDHVTLHLSGWPRRPPAVPAGVPDIGRGGGTVGCRGTGPAEGPVPAWESLRPLTTDDREIFENHRALSGSPLGGTVFAAVWVWSDLMDLRWTMIGRRFCLFARTPDGVFMPISPERPVLQDCFSWMDRWNSNPSVTRIENVAPDDAEWFSRQGYEVKPKDPEYLYRREDLAALAGDRYKSQRWAVNAFRRAYDAAVESYSTERHFEKCLELYQTWKTFKLEKAMMTDYERALIEDSTHAHRRALRDAEAAGLSGWVVRLKDRIAAYSLGCPASKDGFAILFEAADPEVKGAAQFVFREVCRAAEGYAWINTLDDSGVASLRRVKESYHPARRLTGHIVRFNVT